MAGLVPIVLAQAAHAEGAAGLHEPAAPVFLFVGIAVFAATAILLVAHLVGPERAAKPSATQAVKLMPYESGMDPVHSARLRFDVRFYLVAIEFLIFDVELLFLYPWAVSRGSGAIPEAARTGVFVGVMVFLALLTAGFVYTWRKGVFRWR